MSEAVRLRPHHLLCLRGFQGHGYDVGFVAHMTRMVAMMQTDDPPVRLVRGADDLCGHCPNNAGGDCKNAGKVGEKDSKVLVLGGWSPEDTVRWSEWGRRLQDVEVRRRLAEEACGDCEWTAVCLWHGEAVRDENENENEK